MTKRIGTGRINSCKKSNILCELWIDTGRLRRHLDRNPQAVVPRRRTTRFFRGIRLLCSQRGGRLTVFLDTEPYLFKDAPMSMGPLPGPGAAAGPISEAKKK